MHLHPFRREGGPDSSNSKIVQHTFSQTTLLHGNVFATGISAVHVGAELLEITAHQLVQALVSGGVLDEPRLVAEAVEAIIAQAMKVALVVAIPAHHELTVLVEAKFQIASRNGLVFGKVTDTLRIIR